MLGCLCAAPEQIEAAVNEQGLWMRMEKMALEPRIVLTYYAAIIRRSLRMGLLRERSKEWMNDQQHGSTVAGSNGLEFGCFPGYVIHTFKLPSTNFNAPPLKHDKTSEQKTSAPSQPQCGPHCSNSAHEPE